MIKKISSLLLFLFVLPVVLASFSLDPPSFDFGDVNVGDSLNLEFTVTNDDDTDLLISFTDILLVGDEDEINFGAPSSDIILLQGESIPISTEFIVPNNVEAGAYSGSFTATDNESDTNDFIIDMNILEIFDFVLETQLIHFGNFYYNQTASADIVLRNNGNTDITNIDISDNADQRFELEYSEDSFDVLGPGGVLDITASMIVPFNETIMENLTLGDLLITYDGGDIDIDDYFQVGVLSYLEIDNLKFIVDGVSENLENGDLIEEIFNPLDEVEIQLTAKNLMEDEGGFKEKIKNVEVEITIFEIDEDDDDLTFESDEVTLDHEGNEQEHIFTFEFDVPGSTESAVYDIKVELKGTDGLGNTYLVIWDLELDLQRESHDLIIDELDLVPPVLTCRNDFVFDLEILNIGDSDEDYVRYTIENSDLGINFEKSRFEIEEDEDDNSYRESVPFDLINPVAGVFELQFLLYRDFDLLEDAAILELTINECGDTIIEEEVQEQVQEVLTVPEDVIEESVPVEVNEEAEAVPEARSDIFLIGKSFTRGEGSSNVVLLSMFVAIIVLLAVLLAVMVIKGRSH